MGHTWIQTKHEGVRYREHATRKHGVKPDQYFAIRYRVDGKRREEGLGWASQGWTAQKATLELAKLKEAQRTGQGAVTLGEKRAMAAAEREARLEAENREKREAMTFSEFFNAHYWPQAQRDKKPGSYTREDSLFRHWISKAFGNRPLVKVGAVDVERLKKSMHAGGLSPRTIEYALAVTRQVFNHARRLGFYSGDSPTKLVKKPKVNNARLRYLTHDEADRLLKCLAENNPDMHDMAVVSLHCGLRFGEVASLIWSRIELAEGRLVLLDTKHGDRIVPMTGAVKAILKKREGGEGLVFPDHSGKQHLQCPKSFMDAVDRLALNEGREDTRERVTFHTCRHTFASWHVLAGTDLYTLGRLMGHKTPSMTARYGHLSPEGAARATAAFEASMQQQVKTSPVRVSLAGQ